MIFATVGTQLPFDRLIRALDGWAASNGGVEVFAQIGRGEYEPSHIGSATPIQGVGFFQTCVGCFRVVSTASKTGAGQGGLKRFYFGLE